MSWSTSALHGPAVLGAWMAALPAVVLSPGPARAQEAPLVFAAQGDVLGLYPADVAIVFLHQQNGREAVRVELVPEATQSLADLTRDHVGEVVEVRFCGRVLMRPELRTTLEEGQFWLAGRLGQEGPMVVAILKGEQGCPALGS